MKVDCNRSFATVHTKEAERLPFDDGWHGATWIWSANPLYLRYLRPEVMQQPPDEWASIHACNLKNPNAVERTCWISIHPTTSPRLLRCPRASANHHTDKTFVAWILQ